MSLDRLYNAHTRRIIATAYTNVIHLDQSEHEISQSAAPRKSKPAHLAKNSSITPSKCPLEEWTLETLNKYTHSYLNMINCSEVFLIGVG